ncbi:MAG TPA: ABC transporter permease [Ramlibacter sp.]|nr:ABC transporter permease [Ramlibacter sp.]
MTTLALPSPAAPSARRLPAAFWLLLPASALLLLGLLLPVGQVLLFSLNPPEPGTTAPVIALSGENFARLFGSAFYRGVLFKTLWLSALTTAITAVLGMVLALSVWRAPARWRGLLVVVILAPLLVSIVARTYGWMVVLGDKGALNQALLALGVLQEPLKIMYTPGAVLVGLVHVFLPFMVLSLLGALERIDASLPEASATLGAGPIATFRHVILPLAVPGLASGAIIVFSLAMSSYVTPALMGGSKSGVLTTFIYQQFSVTMNWQFGAALVALLLGATLAVLCALLAWSTRLTRAWSHRP